MPHKAGHIETRIMTYLVGLGMLALLIWGGNWGRIIFLIFLTLVLVFIFTFMIIIRLPDSKKDKDRKNLDDFLDAYESKLDEATVKMVREFDECGEYGLALEWLSDKIYEDDIELPLEGRRLFQQLAQEIEIHEKYWRYLDNGPPYPDLSKDITDSLATPSLENAKTLALNGDKIRAIRMYREITGASLSEANKAVEYWMN